MVCLWAEKCTKKAKAKTKFLFPHTVSFHYLNNTVSYFKTFLKKVLNAHTLETSKKKGAERNDMKSILMKYFRTNFSHECKLKMIACS